jgi:hypothetical protein
MEAISILFLVLFMVIVAFILSPYEIAFEDNDDTEINI